MRNPTFQKPARALFALLALAPVFALPLPLTAADGDEIKLLREQLQALEQKILILERKQELKTEADAVAARTAPVVTAGEGGFRVTSADKKFEIRTSGTIQMDGRFFLNGDLGGNDTFLMRRLRPVIEGTVSEKFGFRLMPELASSTFTLQDGYVTYLHSTGFNVLFGKAKSPFDIERLASASRLLFMERGYTTSLAPNRDIGVQFFGDVAGGRLSYQLALQNGVADNGSSVTDSDNAKEVVARLFAHPFKGSESLLEGLGLGIALSTGEKNAGTPAGYRTNAQQTFFAWAPGVTNSGTHTRVSPQFYYYAGPVGLSGAWTSSKQELARAGVTRTIDNTGWFVAAHYVLTGENAGYRGVTPKSVFSPKDGTWGAFEVAARHGVLAVDDDVFVGAAADRFANPATSSREARGWTFGINWYLNRNVKATVNYERTDFDGDAFAVTGGDEKALFTRVQLSY